MRPILAVNCRPQSSQMKDLVLSEDSAAGTDWLVEPFRQLRFSSALAIRTSSKCCYKHVNSNHALYTEWYCPHTADQWAVQWLASTCLMTFALSTNEAMRHWPKPMWYVVRTRLHIQYFKMCEKKYTTPLNNYCITAFAICFIIITNTKLTRVVSRFQFCFTLMSMVSSMYNEAASQAAHTERYITVSSCTTLWTNSWWIGATYAFI